MSLETAAEQLSQARDDSSTSRIPYVRWEGQLEELARQFNEGVPYRHVILDDFLDDDFAHQVEQAFPQPGTDEWIQYRHYNESTLGNNRLDSLPLPLRQLMEELLRPRFASFMSRLTGIQCLQSDSTLEGSGLHMTEAGGFLRVHTDFTHHNRLPELRRRCNLILYLNRDWQEEWGGSLELWNEDVTSCVRTYLPSFNRALVFETTDISYHGYPLPLSPPAGVSRKSLTSYYYTLDNNPKPRSTHYKVRPGESSSRLLVSLDNILLSLYARVKRMTGISDQWTGRILSMLPRKKT